MNPTKKHKLTDKERKKKRKYKYKNCHQVKSIKNEETEKTQASRLCLRCGLNFKSDHKFNRICSTCKVANERKKGCHSEQYQGYRKK